MAPKKLTNLAVILAAISSLGIPAMLVWSPDWGVWSWWPAAGLGLSVLLVIMALLKGAAMAAGEREDMVDMLNDCNAGIPPREGAQP
jgi:hypothetical protein